MPDPRGKTNVKLGGEDYVLRLTVGAAIDLEEHFGCHLDDLEEKLAKPSMKDLLAVVQILTRGGGKEIPEDDLRDLEIADLEPAITSAFAAAQGDETPGKKQPAQRRGGAGKR